MDARETLGIALILLIALSFSPPPLLANPTGLTTSVSTDRRVYTEGQLVNITITVTNNGTDTVILHFATTCQFMFWVAYGSVDILYYEQLHTHCLKIPTEIPLLPGESITSQASWNQFDDSGMQVIFPRTYTIVVYAPAAEYVPVASKTINLSAPPPPLGLEPLAILLLSLAVTIASRRGLSSSSRKAAQLRRA